MLSSTTRYNPIHSKLSKSDSIQSAADSMSQSNDDNTNESGRMTHSPTKESSIPLPRTPSMNRNSTSSFESRDYTMFQTPNLASPERRTDQNILLSPSSYSSTPRKRRSTDFYSLLKTPRANDEATNLKRRSVAAVRHSHHKSMNTVSSPEQKNPKGFHRHHRATHSTSFVFHDSLGSPLLQSPSKRNSATFSRVPRRKSDANIKEISDTLRTRLNYAKAKIQHGWSEKSIDEVKQHLEEQKKNKILTQKEKTTYDEFWKTPNGQLPRYEKQNDQNMLPRSPKRNTLHRYSMRGRYAGKLSLDEVASRHRRSLQGSANKDLVEALSPRKPMNPRSPMHAPPSIPPPHLEKSPLPESGLEHDAIVSLMSLSSPKKTSPYRNHGNISPIRSPTKSPSKLEPPIGRPAMTFPNSMLRRRGANNDDDDDDATEIESPEDESRQTFGSTLSRELPPPRSGFQPAPFAGLGLRSATTGEALAIKPAIRHRRDQV